MAQSDLSQILITDQALQASNVPNLEGQSSDSLDLVANLCQRLSAENINYCHWKSNAALVRSALGLNDLDLLVAKSDLQKFLAILHALGFKEAHSPDEIKVAGVRNYYGYDPHADVFVNVHAHFKLVIGHDLTKNFHLPIEQPYLAASIQQGLFRVASPEFEMLLFVVRMVIKHFTWDSILLGHGHLSPSEQNELNYLQNHISMSVLDEALSRHLKVIDPLVFYSCYDLLKHNASLLDRLRVGQKLVNSLAPYARHSLGVDAGLKVFRRFSIPIKRRILRRYLGKHLQTGGAVIAVVGGDGAGKTTLVEAIHRWLGSEFAVRKFHMGKPQPSFLTLVVRGILKIGRKLGLYPYQRAEVSYTKDPEAIIFPGYPWLFREVCTARDRYLTSKRARRLSAKGEVAILDRFPLDEVKFMDGPQASRMTSGITRNWLLSSLMNLEESFYRKISPPDLLIVLRVPPDIAVQRKRDELEKTVRPRSTEIWEVDWSRTSAHVIDASAPLEAVLTQVKALIWENI